MAHVALKDMGHIFLNNSTLFTNTHRFNNGNRKERSFLYSLSCLRSYPRFRPGFIG